MRRAVLALTLAAAVAATTACLLKRSPQSRTFVLDALAAAAAAPPAVPPATPVDSVGVLRVSVPGWIDRPQLSGRTADGQVVTDEFARWGEPVTRGIQRVVTENLAVLLPDRWVVAAPFPAKRSIDVRVEISLSEASRQGDGSVLVEARWILLGVKDDILEQRRTSHRVSPRSPGPGGVVAGMSEALAALSREIAVALKSLSLPASTSKDND
jgi:uncharacterized lipoprotein YmbA